MFGGFLFLPFLLAENLWNPFICYFFLNSVTRCRHVISRSSPYSNYNLFLLCIAKGASSEGMLNDARVTFTLRHAHVTYIARSSQLQLASHRYWGKNAENMPCHFLHRRYCNVLLWWITLYRGYWQSWKCPLPMNHDAQLPMLPYLLPKPSLKRHIWINRKHFWNSLR